MANWCSVMLSIRRLLRDLSKRRCRKLRRVIRSCWWGNFRIIRNFMSGIVNNTGNLQKVEKNWSACWTTFTSRIRTNTMPYSITMGIYCLTIRLVSRFIRMSLASLCKICLMEIRNMIIRGNVKGRIRIGVRLFIRKVSLSLTWVQTHNSGITKALKTSSLADTASPSSKRISRS